MPLKHVDPITLPLTDDDDDDDELLLLRRGVALFEAGFVVFDVVIGSLVGGCSTMMVGIGMAVCSAVNVGCSAGKVGAGGIDVGVPTGPVLLTFNPRTTASL